MTLLEDLLDLQIPVRIRISPNSQRVVYSTMLSWEQKKGEHAVSTIWVAETGKSNSARQLTTGAFNNRAPRWSPDGQSIAFISDRAKAGESSAIYILPLNGGEAYAITSEKNERPIGKMEFCPDGKSIAYLSADEKTEAQKTKEKDKDDAQVWGEEWVFNRVRLVNVATQDVTTPAGGEGHVVDLAWDGTGTKLAIATVKTSEFESADLNGTTVSVLDIEHGGTREICHFPAAISDLSWAGEQLCCLAAVTGSKSNTSAQAVYSIMLTPKDADPSYEKIAHGLEDCAVGLRKAGGQHDIVVQVQRGLTDQLQILNGRTLFSREQALLAWDASFTTDSDEVILAVAMGATNKPNEVYSTTASGGAMVQLSSHGSTCADKEFGSCKMLSCPSSDGKVDLDAVWITPASSPSGTPAPTFVLIHGGPYSRTTEGFDPAYFMWAPYLLHHGYAVLLPNYRGSSGRGEDFAAYSRGAGKYDYEDVITLTNHAVETGLADKDRLVVGGWSQGGFLSYLCSVRNGLHGLGWKWKAAIPGAGVSDGDTMIFTSDMSTFQSYLTGGKPWQQGKADVSNRQMSSIWEFGAAAKKGIIPPVLILHGEEDERVPLPQAVAFRRALTDARLPFEYVTYPREGHDIKERRHLLDLGERVLKFVEKHIGKN